MAVFQALESDIRALLEDGIATGRFSAAACAVAIGGRVVVELALGTLATHDDDGERLPAEQQRLVDPETLFDLASVTKVFSAHTALALADAGVVDLDAPIADALPSYRGGDRARVTLRHLLSHTSGLPATWEGWREPLADWLARHPAPARLTATPLGDRDALIADLLRTPLEASPGTRFAYACTGYNTAMACLEAVSGRPWHELVAERTLRPLGLGGVTAVPDRARTAATEFQPLLRRGVVRGDVHDEAAWSLGGGAANAGLFGTARDVLAFGEAIRAGDGRVRGELMWDDALTGVLGRPTALADGGLGSALGLRIGDADFMGRSRTARGHTGFTGTSLQIDRELGATCVLLTNRVHPSRDGASLQPLRARIADLVADTAAAS
ncbi:MAG: beta-lactamase family protein [Microbacteriaceae bacterium]|nr:beta-lactamase family protein [Microbacteriaceae bacterium]MCL2796314.1 beta-lactamase family protein [Microbacteriaceae bacterium]